MRRALPICIVVALALPASAFAHASLLKASPSYKQELAHAPHWIALTFDQDVELIPNAVVVLNRHGVDLAKPARVDGARLIVPVRALPRGPYTVRWKALSTDGHVVSGVYTFGVAVPAPPVTDAVGAQGPTTTEHIVRWVTDRRGLLWVAFLLGLGFASGLSLSGHSSVSDTEEVADWVHLAAATLWVGGLVQLGLVVWPAAPEFRATAFRRFSRLATVCVAVLISAGTYLSIERLPALHDLWRSGYGHVLLVKLGLVTLALLWGAAHQFIAMPRLERHGARLARSLLGESAVAMAVLLAAAVLVDSKPPARPLPAAPTAAHRR
jgi:methionine-rich copper-binding protein CopC/uncharacterized membrane protein